MHLLPVFGPMRVDQVEPRHFSAWKEAALDRGMSPRSIVRCLITAGQVFTHAQRHHGLAQNPASGRLVPRPSLKWDRSRFNVLTAAQTRAIADAMPHEHGRAAVLISVWTGVRIGELVELRWRDVRWADQRLDVRRSYGQNGIKAPKSDHGRSVPMTPDLVALLDGLSKREYSTMVDDLVLVDRKGDRVNSFTLRRAFYAALDDAGLGHLRRSAAEVARLATHFREPRGEGDAEPVGCAGAPGSRRSHYHAALHALPAGRPGRRAARDSVRRARPGRSRR
jgi:integrase